MKLLTFLKNDRYILGIKLDAGIIDVAEASKIHERKDVPSTITEVINGRGNTIKILEEFVNQLSLKPGEPYVLDEDSLTWGPCVTEPNKIICVGLNYRRHADETNSPYPEAPILFSKFNNTLTSHKSVVTIPKVTKKLDYEVELGIVIGKKVKDISKKEALDHVFGYCTVNDLSARDLQMRTPQWMLGKTCDDFSPVGPYLVTRDEVGDPNNLDLKTYVNGEVRQDSNTSDMIFYCDEIVSYISQYMTLTPGDIILTGTPEGVVLGYPEEQQVYLQHGDEVSVEIEKLGKLKNRFVEE